MKFICQRKTKQKQSQDSVFRTPQLSLSPLNEQDLPATSDGWWKVSKAWCVLTLCALRCWKPSLLPWATVTSVSLWLLLVWLVWLPVQEPPRKSQRERWGGFASYPSAFSPSPRPPRSPFNVSSYWQTSNVHQQFLTKSKSRTEFEKWKSDSTHAMINSCTFYYKKYLQRCYNVFPWYKKMHTFYNGN